MLKTYKIYIGGKFPRTESGRYYTPVNIKGDQLGNICLSSRKDVRNAVVAARGAFGNWSERAAFAALLLEGAGLSCGPRVPIELSAGENS